MCYTHASTTYHTCHSCRTGGLALDRAASQARRVTRMCYMRRRHDTCVTHVTRRIALEEKACRRSARFFFVFPSSSDVFSQALSLSFWGGLVAFRMCSLAAARTKPSRTTKGVACRRSQQRARVCCCYCGCRSSSPGDDRRRASSCTASSISPCSRRTRRRRWTTARRPPSSASPSASLTTTSGAR